MNTDFHVSFGGDHKIKNHVVCFGFTGVDPQLARVPTVETINQFLPTLQALKISDTPDSAKIDTLGREISLALWKKLPAGIRLDQLEVRLSYADTPAVETYCNNKDASQPMMKYTISFIGRENGNIGAAERNTVNTEFDHYPSGVEIVAKVRETHDCLTGLIEVTPEIGNQYKVAIDGTSQTGLRQ